MQRSIADGKKRRAAAESAASGTLMTLQEVADYLRVTRATIHRMLKRNQIPTFRIGRQLSISRRSTTGARPSVRRR